VNVHKPQLKGDENGEAQKHAVVNYNWPMHSVNKAFPLDGRHRNGQKLFFRLLDLQYASF
jgi:hypothetical protein